MADRPAILEEAIKRFDEAKKAHQTFVRAYEKRERAYLGILRNPQDVTSWRHNYRPKYAFNLLETIVAGTIEMGLRINVRPFPRADMTQDEAVAMLGQTDAITDLLRHEHRVDEMDFKQRPLFLTSGIGGVGVGKCYWNYSEGTIRRQGIKNTPVHDANGNVLTHVPVVTEIRDQGVLRDHSTFEVIDPRDFIMHESARTLQPFDPGGAQYVFHRCWYSKEQLLSWQRSGFIRNVDELTETRSFSEEYQDREKAVFQVDRTKDLIEVLEYWKYENGIVKRALIGNRDVVLRDVEDSPFWHGGYPFVLCSSMPYPFSPRGMSDIELIEELQQVLWEIQNQTLDNIELVNNFITLIRSDVPDPDAFETYPGARWPVESTDQAQILTPPYQLANVTAQREAMIKGDLQNVTSATPFVSGADAQTVDNKTATGASIVMNAAQQRLAVKKFQSQQALRQEAQMRLKNCQQFITDTRLVHILGPGGQTRFRQIDPLQIQGEFIAELEAMGESLMRQERRAEAGQVLQVMQQVFASSYAAGTPIDLHRVVLWYLRQWDLQDEAESFFRPEQQPDPETLNILFGNAPHVQIRGMMDPQASDEAAQVQGALPPGQESPQGAPQPNMGTTSSTAVDASKPSATGGMSMSPMLMLQRAMAARGGMGRKRY